VHGRKREVERADEAHFGVFEALYSAKLKQAKSGAQWTGITTTFAERLLLEGSVDAVVTVAPHADDVWRPVPVIVTNPEELSQCRGMRMGYAPVVAAVEAAIEAGHRRIAVVAIPCQTYALRAMEQEWKSKQLLDEITLIGTPCSDNTHTEHFHEFLALLTDDPSTVTYLEFCTDFHVELRFQDGVVQRIPFLSLPISNLRDDFFPTTCRTCVDYTNALSDITVGYMGGHGEQWLIVRNTKGASLLNQLAEELKLSTPVSSGKRHTSVAGFIENTRRAAGGLPLRKMPNFLRPIMAKLMPLLGPKGLEFARARVEMKAAESLLHLYRQHPKRLKHMVPWFIHRQVAPYGITLEDEHAK